jgi:hypothetical protein
MSGVGLGRVRCEIILARPRCGPGFRRKRPEPLLTLPGSQPAMSRHVPLRGG